VSQAILDSDIHLLCAVGVRVPSGRFMDEGRNRAAATFGKRVTWAKRCADRCIAYDYPARGQTHGQGAPAFGALGALLP
jgi:hypothetical protein